MEAREVRVNPYMKCGWKRAEPPAKDEGKLDVIDSEEYREGTYEKLDNRYPLGVSPEKKGRDDRVLLV